MVLAGDVVGVFKPKKMRQLPVESTWGLDDRWQ